MRGVTVTATGGIPSDQVREVEQRVAAVVRSAGEVTGTHVTLRREPDSHPERRFVADAIAFRAGRVIPAHAVGASPVEAGTALAGALERGLGDRGS